MKQREDRETKREI